MFDKYRMQMIPRAPDEGGAGGGAAGAGGDAGAGAGGGGAAGAGSAGGAGGGSANWYASHNLDADAQRFIADKGFTDLGSQIASHREADKMARSRNVIEKPDPKNVKDWGGFTELGWVPDRAKYQIAKPQLQQGQTMDEAGFSAFTTAAHEAKLAPWQAEAVYNAMRGYGEKYANDADAAATAKRDGELKSLRDSWGDKADANTEMARRAFRHLGADDFSADEVERALGSARTLKLFQRVGEMLGEDTLAGAGNGGGSFGGMSPEQAGAQRRKLEGDADWLKVFNDPRHPQWDDYVAQRQRLLNIEFGGQRR